MNILLDMPRDLPKSTTVDFWDTDTLDLYKHNSNKLGSDWIWNNKSITYKVNSLGYRMDEFETINWNNYFAVFGCSFTAGTGIPLEDTWGYRISKNIGYDLVNGAVPGGGNEVILMNISRLLQNKQSPKFIIVNWSAITRKCYWYNDNVLLYGSIIQNNKIWDASYQNYLQNDEQWKNEFLEIKRQVDTLCKLANIPVWHITNFRGYEFTNDVGKILPMQSDGSINGINNWAARDYNIKERIAHPGIELHDRIFNSFMDIKNKFI